MAWARTTVFYVTECLHIPSYVPYIYLCIFCQMYEYVYIMFMFVQASTVGVELFLVYYLPILKLLFLIDTHGSISLQCCAPINLIAN
jgi:hypothetical protein